MKKFTVDHLLNMNELCSAPDISPDGQWLSLSIKPITRGDTTLFSGEGYAPYTMHGVPTTTVGSQIVLVNTQTGEMLHPFPENMTSWGGQWSSDGTQLAACVQQDGMACLGIWQKENQEYILWKDVAIDAMYDFEVPKWTPDSKRVVVKLHTKAFLNHLQTSQPLQKQGRTVQVSAYDPNNPTKKPKQEDPKDLCDLANVDVTTGETQYLLKGWDFRCWRISPNGKHLALMHFGNDNFPQGLVVMSLTGADKKLIAPMENIHWGKSFNWCPDSQKIAYRMNERLYVVSADGSDTSKDITGNEKIRLTNTDEPPRWSLAGDKIYCLVNKGIWVINTDGNDVKKWRPKDLNHHLINWIQPLANSTISLVKESRILTIIHNRKTRQNALLFLGHRHESRMTEFENCAYHPIGVCSHKPEFYFASDKADRPSEIFKLSDNRPTARIYTPNPLLDKISWGGVQLIEWPTPEGRTQQGVLALPPDYVEGQKLPLVISVYPDYAPAFAINQFGLEENDIGHPHLLTGNGYAAFYPNMPMKRYHPMSQFPNLILPALDHLVTTDIIDPDRVGVMGHSYGGYCALALLTQTNRFKTGICFDGITNLTSFYAQMGWKWAETDPQGGMRGTPWDYRKDYVENSPFFFLDQIQTPVLLISGSGTQADDLQAHEAFHALHRLGKPVEWRSYKGESHDSTEWSKANFEDLLKSSLRWLDKHLKKNSR